MTPRPDAAPPIQFRSAERADVPAIVRLLADDKLGARRERFEVPLPEVYLRAFDAMAAQAGTELIVATQDGDVVGCLQLNLLPGLSRQGMTRAQIESVRVDARCRGQRLGERLIRHAIERARAAGCGLVQLTTDKSRADAHRFYERLGFVASHEGMKLALD